MLAGFISNSLYLSNITLLSTFPIVHAVGDRNRIPVNCDPLGFINKVHDPMNLVIHLVDVKKLLEYNRIERHAFFDKLTELTWEQFTENREASFHSIRNIFVHTLQAIDFWLDFLQKQNLGSKQKFDEFKSYEDLRAYMGQVEKRMQSYLESITTRTLSEKLEIHRKGKAEVTIEDILVHMFEEELHHRGELIALLWQMNIEPPLVAYPP